MSKYSFKNDYSEGAHPKIIEKLLQTNYEQEDGYGYDQYSTQATELIKTQLKSFAADIYFVSGGTQANLIAISAILKPYESIIATNISHIATHETGAIEATGHKINIVTHQYGKLTIKLIQETIHNHTSEHMVKPKAVFISNATELGTIYRKSELYSLSAFCRDNGLFLYLDGARLGVALTSINNDLTLADIAECVDVFYIGGTKNGALLGEAIVINNNLLKENFRFYMKQKGALLAKGRLLGIQFLTLFKDNLFFEISQHANNMALKLAQGLKSAGYSFLVPYESNQLFPILPHAVISKLSLKYNFYVWDKIDNDNSIVRLVTSWATSEMMVDNFIQDL